MPEFAAARRIVSDAVGHAFPAAVVEVGRYSGIAWEEAFGRLTYEADSSVTTLDTVFDLASLTKAVVTTTLAMVLVERERVTLSDVICQRLSDWQADDRAQTTLRDLLEHSSGLTAHLPFFQDHRGRKEFQRAICALPLEYISRSQSVYSDLGFILLGFMLEDSVESTLDVQFADISAVNGWGGLGFRPNVGRRARAAPTGIDTWRDRLLKGEVHDENTFALGGVAGHAGTFGTAREVGSFARTVLGLYRGEASFVSSLTFEHFIKRSQVPGSSRALGWDTMLPTSSCGTMMSATAIGHTGFTGTSLWIDPSHDIYVVFLTNRVHPTRYNDAILSVRPALHDAILSAAPWC